VKADGLANAPLDTVAHHGFSQRAGNRETHARPASSGLKQAESHKKRACKPGSFVINPSEILRSQQADTFWKTVRAVRSALAGPLLDGHLPLRTDSELLPTPGTAPRQHSPSVLGFHAAPKSMGLGTVAVIRLKGTFRHFSSTT
jgi:hypothetical protein